VANGRMSKSRSLHAGSSAHRTEITVIAALCLLAMAKIFVFSAAFPFFNNVDEQAHFDVVVKYSHGYLPREGTNFYGAEAGALIALYASPEYLQKPEKFSTGVIPQPVWTFPTEQTRQYVQERSKSWQGGKNLEAFSPPVYYATAALWFNLGKLLGLEGGYLLYWIRFLNTIVFGALILLSHLLCRDLFPAHNVFRLGVPMLLVFFPQDFFYSINSDVLSPLFFLISIFFLHKILVGPRSLLFHLFAGFMVALTFLIKLINVPVFLVLVVVFAYAYRSARASDRRVRLVLMMLSAVLPIVCWFGWNLLEVGDLTGTAEKVQALDWTTKPLLERFNHPMFTPAGFLTFISELTRTFWRGEFVWGLERIASPAMDTFFVASSFLLLLVSLVLRPMLFEETLDKSQNASFNMAALIVLSFVLAMVWLSLAFDFGRSWYPSQTQPYFTSGRLISGALIPFLVLYVGGVFLLGRRLIPRLDPLWVILAISLSLISVETYLSYKVFGSNYNWFHLH
jgi:hypothetical protein